MIGRQEARIKSNPCLLHNRCKQLILAGMQRISSLLRQRSFQSWLYISLVVSLATFMISWSAISLPIVLAIGSLMVSCGIILWSHARLSAMQQQMHQLHTLLKRQSFVQPQVQQQILTHLEPENVWQKEPTRH